MNAMRLAVLIAAPLLVGFLIGTQVNNDGPQRPARNPENSGEEKPSDDAAQAASLSLELDAAQKQIQHLQKELARALKRDPGETVPSSGIATETFTPGAGAGGTRVISNLAEAQAAFERGMATGDLELMWLLGADLLALGEEAYPVFEDLFEQFFEKMTSADNPFRETFRDEELWMGRFMRTFAEQHEDFLAYGLHLAQREDELPEALADFKRNLFDDDFLPVVLAFHGGENPQITQGWLEVLEGQMGNPDSRVREDALIFALAQLPDDRAAELIGTWLAAGSSRIDDSFRALIAHGSPRAMQIARQNLHLIEDEEQRAMVEALLGG